MEYVIAGPPQEVTNKKEIADAIGYFQEAQESGSPCICMHMRVPYGAMCILIPLSEVDKPLPKGHHNLGLFGKEAYIKRLEELRTQTQ